MVTTGAKGSTVNQSQVSCALGQQALEGRRVPRMSSGRTLPSFAPYDPNPRADGFIADRFLTGVRPQEYYFHCMAGREGLVDTAVKTSRSGYLQRCLVKHLEELKVTYDNTVRDGEGGVIQFLYGEDGIDPTKAAHLDCASSTLQYIARNHKALEKRNSALPNTSMAIAEADRERNIDVSTKASGLLQKGSYVEARKLRFGTEWKRGAICNGWFGAHILKVHSNGTAFDLKYIKDKSIIKNIPIDVEFEYAGGKKTRAMSSKSLILRPAVPDPILSDVSKERGGHRLGSSGSCVSEKVAGSLANAISDDKELKGAMKSASLSAEHLKEVVAAKYSSALCAPGEAVGCIAAQSIGEPSTQMTLNTFHLAGSGANVTLGIPRLREIIMTASRELKTPTMSVPLLPAVTERQGLRLTRYFTRLTLMELVANKSGIAVRESLEQNSVGHWERAYYITLKFQSAERIKEAFGLSLEEIASVITSSFMPTISKVMKLELKRSNADSGASLAVYGGEASDFLTRKVSTTEHDEHEEAEDDGDEDGVGAEDGVAASRFTHKEELTSYDDDKEEEEDDDEILPPGGASTVTDDEFEDDDELMASNSAKIDKKSNAIILAPLRVDPSTRPLLMVGLVERAASKTLVRSRPKIECGYINEEDGRGRCLQTAGCNFEEMWRLDNVDHCKLLSNDIWALRCAYGVEAARMNIVGQIRGVFAVYGISVDPRHLTLIADYMTYDGGYKAMNRIGMVDSSSSFQQMSYETTAKFMIDAALNNRKEAMESPSSNIVLGRPIRHGTGAFECIVKA